MPFQLVVHVPPRIEQLSAFVVRLRHLGFVGLHAGPCVNARRQRNATKTLAFVMRVALLVSSVFTLTILGNALSIIFKITSVAGTTIPIRRRWFTTIYQVLEHLVAMVEQVARIDRAR